VLELSHLRKTYIASKREGRSPVVAVDDLSVELTPGEFFTLLGPSGCGKTTTLRCIAGLEHAEAGQIRIGERVVFSSSKRINVPSNERGLGMVFQSYAIWPHMDVFRNVAFPLTVLPRRERPSKAEIKSRVERVLSVMQLETMAYRPSTDLSGGQQQRLALARALVMEPRVLLLDEPLSNLDAKLREGMRLELKRLQRSLGLTTVYVTHDQLEALAMSNRIGVMRDGRFEQIGEPRDIYQKPASRFVADFIGTSTFMAGYVEQIDSDGIYVINTDFGLLKAQGETGIRVGAAVDVGVRTEVIEIVRKPMHSLSGEPGRWEGVIAATAFLGEFVEHLIEVKGLQLHCRTSVASAVEEGSEVEIRLSPEGAWVFETAKNSIVTPPAQTPNEERRWEGVG
jgi:iron(III) transport system ATP-binding protein